MRVCILCTRYKSMNAETPNEIITFYFCPSSWNASKSEGSIGGGGAEIVAQWELMCVYFWTVVLASLGPNLVWLCLLNCSVSPSSASQDLVAFCSLGSSLLLYTYPFFFTVVWGSSLSSVSKQSPGFSHTGPMRLSYCPQVYPVTVLRRFHYSSVCPQVNDTIWMNKPNTHVRVCTLRGVSPAWGGIQAGRIWRSCLGNWDDVRWSFWVQRE